MKRGLKVTMVELQEKILSLLLDAKGSDIVEAVVRKAGVNIVTGQSVQKILGKPDNDGAVGGVLLTKGDQVPCDLVIVAIGVIPRTELVAGTAVKTNRGIVVDNMMQTNVPDVYASGDVAEAYDFIIEPEPTFASLASCSLGRTSCRLQHGRQKNHLCGRHKHEQPQVLRHSHRFRRLS